MTEERPVHGWLRSEGVRRRHVANDVGQHGVRVNCP